MTSRNTKLFTGLFILLAYISIGVFGLFKFNHAFETPMTDCPYSENGFSVCENSLDHINDWRQFSTSIFPTFFTLSLLMLGIVLYFFNKQNFLKQEQYFYKWKYYIENKKFYTFPNRIIRWLSLFENSPAF